jgi:glycosyltransferase involved in cell wall biosynthesis
MISIGLPAIKPQFLSEAIQSVQKQKYSDFELIVFNDRSDEKIRNIVKSFEDPRIRYFEEESVLAVVENWNRVLSYARGEYFVLFSDDDRYHPDFLLEMNKLFAKYPLCNIFHCRVRKISACGKFLACTAPCPDYESGLDFICHRLNGDREQFVPEFVVRTKKLKAIGGFVDLPLAWGSDDLTWFQLAMEGGIAYCSKLLFDWRQSPLQISETGNVEKRLLAVEKYSTWLRSFIETIHPAEDKETLVLKRITSLYISHAERQKAHLVAINARHTSFLHQIAFFFKNRKKYQLKIQWLLYSCYSKLRQGTIHTAISSETHRRKDL